MSRLPQTRPLLYLISDRLALPHNPENPESTQIAIIRAAARSGCQLVQIREKDLPARDLFELARAAVAAARPDGAKVLINDRLDLAIAAGADGVHLPASSFPAAAARAAVRKKGVPDFLIGVSTHSLAEARAAEAGGADFIVCGPVYETPSKLAYGAPLGIEKFVAVCESVKIPVLALGGIDLSNFREPLQRGAAGIAAIRLFSDREILKDNIKSILGARVSS